MKPNYIFQRSIDASDMANAWQECLKLSASMNNDYVLMCLGKLLRQTQNKVGTDGRLFPGQAIGRLQHIIGEQENVNDGQVAVVRRLVDRLKQHCYGFNWWCPMVPAWESPLDACEQVLTGHTNVVPSVSWSPNGQCIASGSWDNTVRIWDATTGHCDQVLTGHTDEVYSVSWSPNGQRIASGSWDKTIRIWDATTGHCDQVLTGHTGAVTSVLWSPNGQSIASVSYDKTVRIWDATTGHCDKVLTGHTSDVNSVSWSPDGQRIASGSLGQNSSDLGRHHWQLQ